MLLITYSSLIELQTDPPLATFEVGITLCAAPYDFFLLLPSSFFSLRVINFRFGTCGSLLPNDRFGLYMKYPLYALSNLMFCASFWLWCFHRVVPREITRISWCPVFPNFSNLVSQLSAFEVLRLTWEIFHFQLGSVGVFTGTLLGAEGEREQLTLSCSVLCLQSIRAQPGLVRDGNMLIS